MEYILALIDAQKLEPKKLKPYKKRNSNRGTTGTPYQSQKSVYALPVTGWFSFHSRRVWPVSFSIRG